MELKLDQWATVVPTGFPGAIAPPLGKKQEGWDNGEEPPAAYFNWTFQAVADSGNEIANAITGLGVALDPADLTQLLAGIQRQHMKSAIRGLRLAKDYGSGLLRGIAVGGADGPAGLVRLLAVGNSGLIVRSGGYDAPVPVTAAGSFSGTFWDVRYSSTQGEYVMVGDAGEIQSITAVPSPTITRRRFGTSGDLHALAVDDTGHIVAVGDSEAIWTCNSGNLALWASRNPGFAGTPNVVTVAYGGGRFVCGTDQGDLASSDDLGATWTIRMATAGSSGGYGSRVHYHSTLGWLYHWRTNVYWSADGATWTLIQSAAPTSTQGPGLFVAPYCWMIGYGGNAGCYVDGHFGHGVNAPVDFRLDYIADVAPVSLRFSRGELVAVGGASGSCIYVGGST